MIVHVVDGTYELYRHFYGARRFNKGQDKPFGAVIGVLLYVVVGLCAFWVRRVLPPYLIMQKSMFLLGGLFAPISLYPDWFYRAARVTPFAANIFLAGNQMIAPSLSS